MLKTKENTICPHCQGTRVVKNGLKANKTQNFLCRSCGKQFLGTYKYTRVNPNIKRLIISMLIMNTDIKDVEKVLGVSRQCV